MHRRPLPRCVLALAIACTALVGAGDATAQRIAGQVVLLGWAEPVEGALVVLLNEALAQVDSARTDVEGRFAFTGVAPGAYQLQAMADGEFSTLSGTVRVEAGADAGAVVLVMPSALMTAATACVAAMPADAAVGVLLGVAFESATRSPLPGAVVRVEWQDSTGPHRLETMADRRGRYHLCRVPASRPLAVRVVAMGRLGAGQALEIEAGTLHRADLAVAAVTNPGEAPRVQVVGRRATGGERGRLSGRLVDEATQQPIVAAVVAIPHADRETLTDGAGRFHLDDLPPAVHVIEIERLGYGEHTVRMDVAAGEETVIAMALRARPVHLPGVSVDARRPLLGLGAVDVKSSRIVTGADMAGYEERGASLESIVRERFPISVQRGVYSVRDLTRRLTCMESRRVTSLRLGREQTDTILDFPTCNMIPVFVDDAPVSDPGTFVDHVRVADFETIVYLPPTEVGIRYGLEGQSSGVLLLYTRGRGPFVDRARNVVR